MATGTLFSMAAYWARLRQKAVLPIPGPSGDDDQIRGLKACRHIDPVLKPRGDACDEFFLLIESFEGLKTALDDLTDGVKGGLTLFSEI